MGPGDYSGRNRFPPPRPRSTDERLATLETNEDHYREDVEAIARQLDTLDQKFGGKVEKLKDSVDALTVTVNQIAERRKWWSKVYAGVTTSALLVLIGFLIRIAIITQGARLPTP